MVPVFPWTVPLNCIGTNTSVLFGYNIYLFLATTLRNETLLVSELGKYHLSKVIVVYHRPKLGYDL